MGDWEPFAPYPIPLAEAQGTIIGDYLVIISGFTGVFQKAVNQAYGIRLADNNPQWRRLADFPVKDGVTHGAFTLVGSKLYLYVVRPP